MLINKLIKKAKSNRYCENNQSSLLKTELITERHKLNFAQNPANGGKPAIENKEIERNANHFGDNL